MKFPNWAPDILKEYHDILVSNLEISEPPDLPLKTRRDLKIMDLIYKPETEKKELLVLLNKLLTAVQMKEVWESLEKRIDDECSYIDFIETCLSGIYDWKRDDFLSEPKLTKTQLRNHYSDIHKTAEKLISLIVKHNTDTRFYLIDHLFDENKLDDMFGELGATLRLFHQRKGIKGGIHPDTQALLIEVLKRDIPQYSPTAIPILEDIASRSKSAMEVPPIVKQPGNPKAHIHYFVKLLSVHMRKKYGQPLHNAVAITTAVTFDLDDYNENSVREMTAGLSE